MQYLEFGDTSLDLHCHLLTWELCFIFWIFLSFGWWLFLNVNFNLFWFNCQVVFILIVLQQDFDGQIPKKISLIRKHEEKSRRKPFLRYLFVSCVFFWDNKAQEKIWLEIPDSNSWLQWLSDGQEMAKTKINDFHLLRKQQKELHYANSAQKMVSMKRFNYTKITTVLDNFKLFDLNFHTREIFHYEVSRQNVMSYSFSFCLVGLQSYHISVLYLS